MAYRKEKLAFISNSPLVREVVFLAFALCVVAFTIFAAYTSYSFYTDGQKSIVRELNDVEKVIEIPLKNALWGVDAEATREILNVMVKNPHVAQAWIEGTATSHYVASSGLEGDWLTLTYPLTYQGNTPGQKHLGVLKLTLSKAKFHEDLKQKILFSSLQNIFRFIVLSCCVIFVFNKKIINPIRKIQSMTKTFNEVHLSPILGEQPSPSVDKTISELESLYREIHVLQENFKSAFEMQKKADEARVEVERQLEKERQKLLLAQRLDTIGQITTQVAHDFGNLIMIINGKTKALDKRLVNEDDLKQTEAIRKTTTRANTLIRKILSMTRTEIAESSLIDPFTSVIEIQDLLKISIGGEISLSVETDGNCGMIFVEPASFENVIINLCVNARDAMPHGGKIAITFKTQMRNHQEFVAISIKDSGQGIPEDIQSKIFDPFFTTKAAGKGTGLGLSQVQDFVKSVGGSLELTSGNEGSCFTLYLPNKAHPKTVVAA